MNYRDKVGFAIGTGRCGTLFLYQLLELEPCVASSHERNPLNEAFHRYCKWYELPVDDEGFLAAKETEIDYDLTEHVFSFEASPHLSLSVRELYERFGAKFVVLLRRPDKVVTSFAHKGFYRRPYLNKNPDYALGCQYPETEKFEYTLARFAPQGKQFREWNEMTYIGKNAWFWSAYNKKILELVETIPSENCKVIKIEDLDYEKYKEIAKYFGIQSGISRRTFDDLSSSKPHSFTQKRNIDDWTALEISQFESQVEQMATRLGYEYRIDALRAEIKPGSKRVTSVRKTGPRLWNLRRWSARKLRDMARFVDCGTQLATSRRMGRDN